MKDDKIERDQRLAAVLANLCDPELHDDEFKNLFKELDLTKNEITQIKNELFFLLYFNIDSLLYGLIEAMKKEGNSLNGARLEFIRQYFNMGWEHLANKQGINNTNEKLTDREKMYKDALLTLSNGSSDGFRKMGVAFADICHGKEDKPKKDLTLALNIPKIWHETIMQANNYIKSALNLN